MLKGKTILLGVSGSIAAYRAAELVRTLVRLHADVHVMMTRNAARLIHPIIFETLTGNPCPTDIFGEEVSNMAGYSALVRKADLLLIAPATANIIGKLAHGLVDDHLCATSLSCRCKKMLAPAMHADLQDNLIVQDNLAILEQYGWEIVDADTDETQYVNIGEWRFPVNSMLMEYVLRELACEKDLSGRRILIAASPIQSTMDPLHVHNAQSVSMLGCALARNAVQRGANVTLVSGTAIASDVIFTQHIKVTTAREMYYSVAQSAAWQDVLLIAAPVVKYQGTSPEDEASKQSNLMLYLSRHRVPEQFFGAYGIETEIGMEHIRQALKDDQVDLAAVYRPTELWTDDKTPLQNTQILLPDGQITLPMLSREEAAKCILDQVVTALTKMNRPLL